MLTVCKIDEYGFFAGQTRQIGEADGCPQGWVRASAPTVPNGKFAIFNGGAWAYVSEGPPASRRLIPKSVIQERANAIGKLGDLMTALLANPLYFGRWFAPDWPEVYADDEGLLEMLAAVGCTEAQIDAVTAP